MATATTQAARVLRAWFDQHPTIKQGAIAAAIGMSQSELSMVLHGRRYPSKAFAEKIAALTGLPVEKLVNPRFVLVVPTRDAVA